jgi:hypothetical protein
LFIAQTHKKYVPAGECSQGSERATRINLKKQLAIGKIEEQQINNISNTVVSPRYQ